MTERIDHATEATSDIRYADEVLADGGDSDVAKAIAAVAQVHATLALVEQQRIANLIAYVAQWNAQYVADEARPGLFDEDTYEESLRRREHASALMREGLGL